MNLQDGDLLACYGGDRAARAISVVTASVFAPRGLRLGPSHVGIVLGSYLYESTTLCDEPCVVAGRRVSGVQAHYPKSRIDSYVNGGGRVQTYRLTDPWRLSPASLRHLWAIVDVMIAQGTPYDTPGAALSGARLYQRSRKFPAADFRRFFCSELVALLLQVSGRLDVENPTRFNPGKLLRRLVSTGVYQLVGERASR